MTVEKRTEELTVHLCPACRHRCAVHENGGALSADYHSQYDQGIYVDSLERTRRRQARLIMATLTGLGIAPDHLIDFGAGRGWFLSEIQKNGASALAGADTSDLSLKTVQSMGIETAGIQIEQEKLMVDLSSLSFQPTTLSLLDVIEHFPVSSLENYMRALLDLLPRARWVIVKVPMAEGILFRIARLFSAMGWNKPYHQLFQVGTFPPHFHYFSKRSLEIFLSKFDIRPRRVIDDPDIDDLLGRIKISGKPFAWASKMITALFSLLGKIFSTDSRIVIGERGAAAAPTR